MSISQIANIIGYIAAGVGIITFFPQAFNVWKTKNTKSISLGTFVMLALVSILWTTYGFLIIAYPVILVNVVVFVMTAYITIMKLKYK